LTQCINFLGISPDAAVLARRYSTSQGAADQAARAGAEETTSTQQKRTSYAKIKALTDKRRIFAAFFLVSPGHLAAASLRSQLTQ
jgi:hypothetical protein